jgi:hypothetical protein
MGDPSDLSSKSMKTSSKASPVENESLREIQLNISKPFVDEYQDPPFPDKKKKKIPVKENFP